MIRKISSLVKYHQLLMVESTKKYNLKHKFRNIGFVTKTTSEVFPITKFILYTDN